MITFFSTFIKQFLLSIRFHSIKNKCNVKQWWPAMCQDELNKKTGDKDKEKHNVFCIR